jgi:hypothetical protein
MGGSIVTFKVAKSPHHTTMKPAVFHLLLCILFLVSCNRYYMPLTTRDIKTESIKKYIAENRRLILREPSIVSNQVHLHTGRVIANDAAVGSVIPVSAISIIEELKYDQRKTSRHNLGIALGVTADVAVVAGMIATLNMLTGLSDWGD